MAITSICPRRISRVCCPNRHQYNIALMVTKLVVYTSHDERGGRSGSGVELSSQFGSRLSFCFLCVFASFCLKSVFMVLVWAGFIWATGPILTCPFLVAALRKNRIHLSSVFFIDATPFVFFPLFPFSSVKRQFARKDEGCFGKIHFTGQRSHLFVGQTTCVGENGQWIASERHSGKNVKLNEVVAGSHIRKYLLV